MDYIINNITAIGLIAYYGVSFTKPATKRCIVNLTATEKERETWKA